MGEESPTLYEFGPYRLDAAERVLLRDSRPVPLAPKTFDLLLTLVERHGHLVERDRLLQLVWPDAVVEESNLAYNVSILRKILGEDEHGSLIETVPKRGYRFVAPVAAVPENTASQSPVGESCVSAGVTEPQRSGRRSRVVWAGVVGGILLLASSWLGAILRHRRSVDFRGRSLVLVAEFQNRTGDPDLDGVVETALEAELAQAAYIGITPRERANDALSLMRRAPASRVPAAFARDVCVRDPAIGAAITGNFRKIGPTYFLAAEVIRPSDGSILMSLTRSAADKNAILPAVRAIAAVIRNRLGEDLPDRGPKLRTFEKVTTDSLAALKLYSDAEALGGTHHWQECEVLLRRAVQIDPQFASAHVLLAWAIQQQQRPAAAEEFLPFADRALGLADLTSERESFLIRGLYHSLRDEYRNAIPFYEASVQRYPEDSPWVSAMLLASYRRSRQYAQATILSRELIRMRPNDPDAYLEAARSCFCPPNHAPREALGYLDRAVDLAGRRGDPEAIRTFQFHRAYYSALVAWLEGDVDRCKAELDRVTAMLPNDNWRIAHAAAGYMTLGQLERAERLLESITDAGLRLRWRTWSALLAGNTAAARRLGAVMTEEPPNPLSAIAMLRAGLDQPAAQMIARWPPARLVDSALIAQGALLLRRNRTGNALEVLAEAAQSISDAPLGERWLGAQILAEAFVARGDPHRAISALLPTGSAPRACGGFPAAVFWPQARRDLMTLYRRQNRSREADAIRKELGGLFRLADASYTVRAALAEK